MALRNARYWRYAAPATLVRRATASLRLASVCLLGLCIGTQATRAKEQAEEFVRGLQERGLHDLASEYLDRLQTSPLVDEATRKQIPYLRGIAYIEQSRQAPDAAARAALLDSARQQLERYGEANPNSVEATEAQLQLATVQASRGQELARQRSQLSADRAYDNQRNELGREARIHFAEARETYQRAEAIVSSELEKLPPTTSATARDDTGSRRQQLRGRVAQLRFSEAQMHFEAAQTYPRGADEFRQLNETAAQELSAVYDEFSTMLVGLYARLYEGRCYQALENYPLALGCYEELVGKENVLPPFRKLIASALHRKAEVLVAQGKVDEAIAACHAALRDAKNDEERQPEWLAVRFRLAEALTQKSQSARPNSQEQKRLLAEARDAYRDVARLPGEYQAAARTAANSPVASSSSAVSPAGASIAIEEPHSFSAAFELGKEALASYNSAKLALPSAEKNNPAAAPELQAQMERGKEQAREYFRAATLLLDDESDPRQVNEARYYLCWLYWEAGDYYRAAALGEFLARRYPDHPVASSAAKISMASFEKLYNESVAASGSHGNEATGEFEARQMATIAEFIVRRWPNTEDADAAFGVLVGYAIRSGKVEEAERMLAQASAPSRPRLELLLGTALWGRYLELSQPEQKNAVSTEELAKLEASAANFLQSGFEAVRKDSPPNDIAATAALYLAQHYLAQGNEGDAIALLENERFGPLALAARGEPSAAATNPYALETYKVALRAYVSISPPQEEKAVAMMQSLDKVVLSDGNTREAADQLTRIYLGMGVALRKQMDDLRDAGKLRQADRVSVALGAFLQRIGEHQNRAAWPVRVWLAQMYYTLAMPSAGSQSSRVAFSQSASVSKGEREYLVRARDAYQKLLDEAEKDSKFAPSETAFLAAKLQLGECCRELGDYPAALNTFSDILRVKESSLAVQRAAALTYQARGLHEDPQWFEFAIHGGYKVKSTGQNRIWGWLRISQVTGRAASQSQQLHDAFYESRLNLSRCRYWAAIQQSGDARTQGLAKARQSIQSLAQQYPELGGTKWKPFFERLLQQINQDNGSG